MDTVNVFINQAIGFKMLAELYYLHFAPLHFLFQITKELARLQQLAQANKLSSDDISGGTITLSNIGAIGGKFGSPLINVPEVAIIAMGRIHRVPQFDEDENVYPASIMTVSTVSCQNFCTEPWFLL